MIHKLNKPYYVIINDNIKIIKIDTIKMFWIFVSNLPDFDQLKYNLHYNNLNISIDCELPKYEKYPDGSYIEIFINKNNLDFEDLFLNFFTIYDDNIYCLRLSFNSKFSVRLQLWFKNCDKKNIQYIINKFNNIYKSKILFKTFKKQCYNCDDKILNYKLKKGIILCDKCF